MSEHTITDSALTADDLDRALATTMTRGRHLVRQRARRRAAFAGVGVVALLAGGFGVLRSLSDDTVVIDTAAPGAPGDTVSASTVPTTKGSSTPAPAVVPDGFDRSIAGGVVTLTNTVPTTPPPTVDAGGGVVLGGGTSVATQVRVETWYVPAADSLEVEFSCLRGGGDNIDSVRYHVEGGQVVVDATISSQGGDQCGEPGMTGATIVLPFAPGELPADPTVVAGAVPSA